MSECKHGRGNCLGINYCVGAFEDCKQQPKPADVQNARELAYKICETVPNEGIIIWPECVHYPHEARELIESAFAAQRQIVRDETERTLFNVLEFYGVPRDRAGTVANGIAVLVTRLNKAIDSEKGNRAIEAKRYSAVLEQAAERVCMRCIGYPCTEKVKASCKAHNEILSPIADKGGA